MSGINFPSKLLSISSSVIIIRPFTQSKHSIQNSIFRSSQDYQILLLKRHHKISFGGNYTFPGGVIEKQDHIEPWKQSMPSFFESKGRQHMDFIKRICALRELFEETSLLFATMNDSTKALQNVTYYNNDCKTNFIKFCQKCEIEPLITELYGFQRIGSPLGIVPPVDAQFYLYFADNGHSFDDKIVMNEDEFIDWQWLTPDEVLEYYTQNKLPLFPPQLQLISHLKFMSSNYTELKKQAKSMDKNILNYVTMRFQQFRTHAMEEKEIQKICHSICDESDLRSDEERKDDLHIYNNVPLQKELGIHEQFTGRKTFEDLESIFKKINTGLWYGDFYSGNDGYPLQMLKSQRKRIWATKELKVVRIEISKQNINDLSLPIYPSKL